MNLIGTDIHSVTFTMAHLNHQGKLCRVYHRPTSEYNLRQVVNEVPGPKTLLVEECHMAQWVKHVLQPYVDRLIVCDPTRNRWIAGEDFADDRSSAIKLAELARGGYIKEIHHCDDEGAALRSLFLHYHDCNKQLVRFKNKLKAKFRQVAICAPGDAMYDPDRRQEWLKQLRTYPHLAFQAQHWFDAVDHLETTKDEVYTRMVSIARRNPAYARLTQIPGIGPVLATGYIAILDTPERFSRRNKLWRYACLGNRYHESDNRVYKNKPSKTGNRVLKWIVRQHYQGAVERCKQPNRFQSKRRAMLERGLDKRTIRRHVCRSLLSTVRAVWIKEAPYRDRA